MDPTWLLMSGKAKEEQTREFLFYKRQQIRKGIDERTQVRLKKCKESAEVEEAQSQPQRAVKVEARAVDPHLIHVISDTDESESDASHVVIKTKRKRNTTSQSQSQSQSIPIATFVRSPSTLQRLIFRLQADPNAIPLDPSECNDTKCPYCTGPLMRQRYALAARLVQIEHTLYGEDAVVHMGL